MSRINPLNPGPFYHGTHAQLSVGDLIVPGRASNFGQRKTSSWVYFTGTLDAAIWGAELSVGEGRGHIYIVEPTGSFVDDPNLTDQKFPGNPTQSFRSQQPLRVVGDVKDWQGHPQDVLQAMKDNLARLKRDGVEPID